ncbi:acetyl-CoA hydrolase/transferase family protein [Sphingomonas sp.]|uniref:acetyl-CoA hydrolase/transferase family protein n=1 Tax=Sphingomonas sp. TaxID=28214 RepID=UPI003B00F630
MKRLAGPEAIIELIQPRSRLVLHSGCGEPLPFTATLADHIDALDGVSLTTMMPMGQARYALANRRAQLDVRTFFPGKALRSALNRNGATLVRERLSRLPDLFESGAAGVDMLLLQVSEPDSSGRMSLGLSVDYMPAVLARRPLVVALINSAYPRTQGDCFVTSDQIDYHVDGSAPVQTVEPTASGDPIDHRIADHVAGLIEDGDVLQIGIGSLPDLVLARLGHRRDLGLHSGIVTDAVMPLIDSGVITNAGKTSFRGLSVATMAAGSAEFYAALHDDRRFSFQSCALTHDPVRLAGIERLTAINGALEVDLTGAVNAEHVDGRIISAPGGLPDFAAGATVAPDGRSIVAVRSTSKDGSTSRILARLDFDSPVTLPPGRIDYLVTEHGVARLRGLDGRRLSAAITDVAHPDFRGALRRRSEKP